MESGSATHPSSPNARLFRLLVLLPHQLRLEMLGSGPSLFLQRRSLPRSRVSINNRKQHFFFCGRGIVSVSRSTNNFLSIIGVRSAVPQFPGACSVSTCRTRPTNAALIAALAEPCRTGTIAWVSMSNSYSCICKFIFSAPGVALKTAS